MFKKIKEWWWKHRHIREMSYEKFIVQVDAEYMKDGLAELGAHIVDQKKLIIEETKKAETLANEHTFEKRKERELLQDTVDERKRKIADLQKQIERIGSDNINRMDRIYQLDYRINFVKGKSKHGKNQKKV